MLFTVAEGFAIAVSAVSLVGLGVVYTRVEKRVQAWLNERSRVKTRRLFIDAERQYNNEQTRVSGSHATMR